MINQDLPPREVASSTAQGASQPVLRVSLFSNKQLLK